MTDSVDVGEGDQGEVRDEHAAQHPTHKDRRALPEGLGLGLGLGFGLGFGFGLGLGLAEHPAREDRRVLP